MKKNSNFIGCNVSMSPGYQSGDLGTGDLGTGDLVTSLYNKGQVLAEYVVVVVAVIAALLTMQIYIIPVLSGRYKEGADGIGTQYAPKKTTSNYTTTTRTLMTRNQSIEDRTINSETIKVTIANSTFSTNTTRTGNETVKPFPNGFKLDEW